MNSATCNLLDIIEGDPLPAALVELVRNSPISSIEDLQLLLLTDSVDEEEGNSAANGGHRLPRSLVAQPAQQAVCKVRTEVVEVTRAMLDRSNANFLLWPPCVEVQRCSGCCNTKSLQCVPVVTHTRYLQVMKIEYMNKRPIYAKAVVSVVDHVECRCQPAPRPPVLKRKSSRRHHGHKDQHRNQTVSQGRGQVKVHSKDELHQWDELKRNQGSLLVDLLEQHWSPRGDTFTQPGEGYSIAGGESSLPEEVLFGPHWTHNSTGFIESKTQDRGTNESDKTLSPVDHVGLNQTLDGGNGLGLSSNEGTKGQGTQTHNEEKHPHSNHVTQKPQVSKWSPVGETIARFGSRSRPTKEPNPEPREATVRRDNKTPEEVKILQIAEKTLKEERKELLLLHKRLDQEKEVLKQQQKKREEEDGRLRSRHRHLPTSSPRPETTPGAVKQHSPAPAGPRLPAHAKKRMRKNRKRISKAAMRAMLM
ncbi:uncharacterized protein pdgfbb isoform X2 [Dunckerocampus dactyliophorus]|uniref:uncharacterized protein pdgfbb isoform X2 n=1 Tax=Dunckerocampus dactyliophorus TaxID=161453 RepID=UPI002405FADD|nr:uncharacterized protein pdgfbb isoform X2 [Dunckerocampus dactyliophorus]XP_054616414.1 uncharacterized protein pdgfbb isoform X2 [Dunckerocampus dactyliophorus]